MTVDEAWERHRRSDALVAAESDMNEGIVFSFRAGYASGVEDSKPKWRPMAEAPPGRMLVWRYLIEDRGDGERRYSRTLATVGSLDSSEAPWEWTEIPE